MKLLLWIAAAAAALYVFNEEKMPEVVEALCQVEKKTERKVPI